MALTIAQIYGVSRDNLKRLYPRYDFSPAIHPPNQPDSTFTLFFISDALIKNAKVPCIWSQADEEACKDEEDKVKLVSNLVRNGIDSLSDYVMQEEALIEDVTKRLDE